MRHTFEGNGIRRASPGGDAGGDFFRERRRHNSIRRACHCLRGDRDAAEFRADVVARQRFTAERVAEAVGVAQGVQQPAAELGLALHETGGEPAFRRALDHHRGALGADGFSTFQPPFGRAQLGAAALDGQALEAFPVLNAQLQAGGTAQGDARVVEGLSGCDGVH
ncbi:MAG: hypothetical protein ACK4YX_10575, partial [Rhabdaerophilum calidifontis]